ncbi:MULTISPECIES: hypothetical protein [unclassified Microbacterium]|uniref:hypothetical protein n=1 Tax=unclassified Microbacterium TaxID=2609290 RepID=UPI00246829DE|nr:MULTISPECIES: hypothetical protein [unclassified Microbacterium]MDH5134621.1 hypothetical protein [Microbacterium sp. RD10]MDH5138175.1 hypothetical protein [Microbacterium sp. RD11]MDH5146105.1 hypothetical protein [Microbacterium sp. RD12]MDH5156154.1 hypothetical protein [Microbacterium sp. RD06]MDH5168102.1 hypothetical protein [Microbacterium sp. RD02]
MNDRMEGNDPMEAPRRRCTAFARSTGERCGNRPIPGGTVCRFHGGGAPAVRRKAKLRLQELVDPAIATLGRVMVTATHDRDKLRAATSILDRAGYPAATRVDARVSVDEQRELLLERLREVRARPRSELAAPGPLEVVEAEVVDEDDDES